MFRRDPEPTRNGNPSPCAHSSFNAGQCQNDANSRRIAEISEGYEPVACGQLDVLPRVLSIGTWGEGAKGASAKVFPLAPERTSNVVT